MPPEITEGHPEEEPIGTPEKSTLPSEDVLASSILFARRKILGRSISHEQTSNIFAQFSNASGMFFGGDCGGGGGGGGGGGDTFLSSSSKYIISIN